MMENFFYNEKFFSDLGCLCDELDLDDELIEALPEDWSIVVTKSSLEPLVTLSPEWIAGNIDDDRWPEESDNMCRRVIKLLKTIDFDAINAAMPVLYYDTEEPVTITKADLMAEICVTLEKGDFVRYVPEHGEIENGRVKSIDKKNGCAFVVYKCAEEWDKYEEYTGQSTELHRLKRGWINGDEPKQDQP